MMYSGDEECDDDCTSGIFPDGYREEDEVREFSPGEVAAIQRAIVREERAKQNGERGE